MLCTEEALVYILLYYALYFILPTLLTTCSGRKKLHIFFLCFLLIKEKYTLLKADRFNELQL